MVNIINKIASGEITKFKFKRATSQIIVKPDEDTVKIVVKGWMYCRDGLEIFVHRRVCKSELIGGVLHIEFNTMWVASHPQLGLMLSSSSARRDSTVIATCRRISAQPGGAARYAQTILKQMAKQAGLDIKLLQYKEIKS